MTLVMWCAVNTDINRNNLKKPAGIIMKQDDGTEHPNRTTDVLSFLFGPRGAGI